VKDNKFAMKLMEMRNEDDYGAQQLMRKGAFTLCHSVTSR